MPTWLPAQQMIRIGGCCDIGGSEVSTICPVRRELK